MFTRPEAARHLSDLGLPIAPKTLAQRACLGDGPLYAIINGRAVYRKQDLEAWVEEQLKDRKAESWT